MKFALTFGLILGCMPWLPARVAAADKGSYTKYLRDFERPREIPYPAENKFTPARYELGRAMFFDPRLSASKSISCATCHNPGFAWEDGLQKAVGENLAVSRRSTPTILNTAWSELLFWDGRANGLEEQALMPIEAGGEMNLPLPKLVARLKAVDRYKAMFEKAYPGKKIGKDTIGKALATFQRTVISGKSPFDLWVEGDETAVSESAKRGFLLFNEKGECAVCHSGWRFTDDGFHDIGLPGTDKGRGEGLPGIESVQFAFKTPTLRNIDRRAPYMHDGSISTLDETIELYDKGGEVKRPGLSENIKPLELSAAEKRDLVEFLKTLTSKDKEIASPALPR